MPPKQRTVNVCQGTGCVSAGAEQVLSLLTAEIGGLNLSDSVLVRGTGCPGLCQAAPLVVIEPDGILYAKVGGDDVADIARSLLPDGKPVERLFYHDTVINQLLGVFHDIPFYYKQQRFILRNLGRIDPASIDDFVDAGGYQAGRNALTEMTPEDIIEKVKVSGLRGLGGAGFPAGRKWEACQTERAEQKYVICNGDEGDPGAFQDCAVME